MLDRMARPLLVALALPHLVTGLWAVLAPRHWYETFPGGGTAIVAADGPLNLHLAGDAGAGFLASGTAALVAAWYLTRTAVRVAMASYLAFSAPHLWYHLRTPIDALTAFETATNTALLAIAVAGPLLLLLRPPTDELSPVETAAGPSE